ncbi:hypothetical protein [Ruegeria arenilitoris]|uniref:hypothetical protein n=1 Tax=Ruegeria arenilitoris TaxID=1173585 RepID=UPI00147D3F08|nr:hypothetical protein [Ruegeria arenilitoris]
MFRSFLAALTSFAAVATSASADNHPFPFHIAGLSPVWVQVTDNAKDGCWTNIGEVKTYAVDQLSLLGVETVDNAKANSVYRIIVNGSRRVDGCYGTITFQVNDWVSWHDNRAFVILHTASWSVAGYDKFNDDALNFTKEYTNEFFGILPKE